MKIEGTSRNSSRLTVKEKKRKSFLRKKKKRVKVSFLVPSLATGHTSAGGALELSPPCLGFKLAAEVEGAGDKSKVEGAGDIIAYAAQLEDCLVGHNSNNHEKEVSMVQFNEKQICKEADYSPVAVILPILSMA